jgi:hypothetical protein
MYEKLELFIDEVVLQYQGHPSLENLERRALLVAGWAKRSITELQPAIDGNSRAGRAIYAYVLERIALKTGDLQFPIADLNDPFFFRRHASFERGGQRVPFEPFTTEVKGLLNEELLKGLQNFAQRHQRSYYFMVRDDDENVAYPQDDFVHFFSASDFVGNISAHQRDPEWETVGAFMEERFSRPKNVADLRRDPLLYAEAEAARQVLHEISMRGLQYLKAQ